MGAERCLLDMSGLLLGTYEDGAPATMPLDAQTTAISLVGRRGSGKTTAAMVLAEEMIGQGLAVVVLDVLGVCWGLRSSADGAGPGLPVTILGGTHGDLPLEPTGGALIAELIIEHAGAYILDLSAFDSKADEDRFAADFAHRLYRLKATDRSPLHLIVDEADNFAPQSPMPGQQRMLGAFNDMVRRGRVRGLGVTLITQRPAAISKNVLSQTECLVAMQTTAPQDREALKAWAQGHGDRLQVEAFLASLAGLKTGEAWLWSPAWLETFRRLTVRRRRTFDSSATPKAGEARIEPRVLAPVDLEALRARLAATIAQAEASDPKKLQAEIVRLRGELAKAQFHGITEGVKTCDHPAEIERLQGELRQAEKAEEKLIFYREESQLALREIREVVYGWSHLIGAGQPSVLEGKQPAATPPLQQPERGGERLGTPLRATVARPPRDTPQAATGAQMRPADERGSTPAAAQSSRAPTGRDTEEMKDEEVRELIKAEVARAVATLPGGRTVYMPAPEVIRLEYQQRALERLMEFVVTIIPEQRAILRFMLGQDRAVTPGQIGAGIGLNNIQVGNALKRMKSANLVSQGGAAGGGSAYRPRIREWVASQLAPHSPTDADVEDVYQAVLGRLAGEVVVG